MSNSSFLIFHSSLQAKPAVVGSNGLEPSTSRLSGVRSNHLSYEPVLQPVVINQPDVAANTLAYLRRFSRSEKLQWPARFQSAKPLLRLRTDCPPRPPSSLSFRLQRDLAAATCRWWRRTESNCRPPACKAGALPAELRPHIRFVPG